MDRCGIRVVHARPCARIRDRFGRPFRLRRRGRSSRTRFCSTAFASIRRREAILMDRCGIRVVHARPCARIKDRFGRPFRLRRRGRSSRTRFCPTAFASIRRCEAILMDRCGIRVVHARPCARIRDRFGRPFRLRRQGRSSRTRFCPTAFASIRRCEAILMDRCGIRVVHARPCARIRDRFGRPFRLRRRGRSSRTRGVKKRRPPRGAAFLFRC